MSATDTQAESHSWYPYVSLVDEIWVEVRPMIGSITLSALVASAMRHVATDHPFLADVQSSSAGINRESLVSALSSQEEEVATASMRDFVQKLLTVFESVAGPIIVKQIMPKVMMAESREA